MYVCMYMYIYISGYFSHTWHEAAPPPQRTAVGRRGSYFHRAASSPPLRYKGHLGVAIKIITTD